MKIKHWNPTEFPYSGHQSRKGWILEYVVSGRGRFPMDMLRYDSAMIVNGEPPTEYLREVCQFQIRGRGCTPERWRSFGWSVHNDIVEHTEI